MHICKNLVNEFQTAVYVDVIKYFIVRRRPVCDRISSCGHTADVLDRDLKSL